MVSEYNYSLILLLIFGSLSSACSVATLYIICIMKRWNNYLQLVLSLTISQLLYDASILMIPCPGATCYGFTVGIRCFTGISSTLWTNVISFVVFYVVVNLKVLDVSKLYVYFFLAIFIPSMILGLMVPLSSGKLFEVASQTYYSIRIASIVLNIVIYSMLTYKLSQRESFRSIDSSTGDPVRALAYRMKYYPIVQIICRIGASWYEQAYGYTYDYTASESTLQKVSILIYAITLPSAGIGYFIIFMVVSPGAFRAIKRHLQSQFPNLFPSEKGMISSDTEDRINIFMHTPVDSITAPTPSFYINNRSSSDGVVDYAFHDEDELEEAINRMYANSTASSVLQAPSISTQSSKAKTISSHSHGYIKSSNGSSYSISDTVGTIREPLVSVGSG